MSESKKLELTPSLAIILAGIMIAAAIVLTNGTSRSAGLADVQGADAVPANVSAPSLNDHIIGSPDAPVVLIEYGDLACYYCGQAHPTLKRIVEESQGQVAWVFRNFPLESIHPEARPAALAAECVADQLGNDAYWKFADTMMANQDKMNSAYYEQTAVALGADLAELRSCVTTEKFAGKLDAGTQEAMENGGQGTPFTIVYGGGKQVPVSGAVPYASFMSVINSLK